VRIAARFEGPPGSVNGGFIAGTLAEDGPAEVRIHRPVPVETELAFDGAELRAGDDLLATVEAVQAVDVGDPPRVSPDVAARAAARTPLRDGHPFPTCFGCGPDSADGLHCLPGPVDTGVWAVAWTPREVSPPVVWAALDCPSAAPIADPEEEGPPYVLGRIAGHVRAPVAAGEPHVVVSWELPGARGRRRPSASALLDAGGAVVAVAGAVWYQLAA
jgi:hypothetical protein